MKIGVVQLRLSDAIEKNRDFIIRYAERAAESGVSILGFPETALTGYVYDGFLKVDFNAVDSALGRIQNVLKGTGLHLIVGTPTSNGGSVYNSAVVLFPDGKRLVYHKQYLVDYETKYFIPGTDTLIFSVEKYKFGVIICRDQNFPGACSDLRDGGVRAAFICSAHYYEAAESMLKREKNRALPVARAYENGIFVLKSNAVGTQNGAVSLGGSLIVDPRGIVVQEAGKHEEAMLVYEIDFTRENPSW